MDEKEIETKVEEKQLDTKQDIQLDKQILERLDKMESTIKELANEYADKRNSSKEKENGDEYGY